MLAFVPTVSFDHDEDYDPNEDSSREHLAFNPPKESYSSPVDLRFATTANRTLQGIEIRVDKKG